ncbi:MAG: tRNA lysidine(34) synthetase TilS [Desulfobacterium sp.]|nr:tRNA lysidine(34) synthetase TilS [Desulfobacterium sp.]
MPTLINKPTDCQFLKKVENTILFYNMVQSQDTILIAVSGGPDSVALLYALHHLSSCLSLKLGVAHVNHQLRAEDAEMDEQFVQSLAQQMDVPFHLKKCDVHHYAKTNRLSLEDAARKVRYDFFSNTLQKNEYLRVATAHHLDDNAELILMNLIRGSGKSGISGIPPIRQKIIIRPLIQVSRKEIMTFLSENKLPYRLDQTNQDISFTRNRIRHRLIPELQSSYNPKIIEALNRMSSIIQQEEEWIENMVDHETSRLIVSSKDQSIQISISGFIEKPMPLQRRIARKITQKAKGNLQKITLRHIDEILLLISKAIGNSQLHLPDNLLVNISGNLACWSIRKRVARPPKDDQKKPTDLIFCYTISDLDGSPKTIMIHEIGVKIQFSILSRIHVFELDQQQKNVALMDMNQIHFPLTIRNCIPGDRFTPLGMTGSQKISKYFINHKVPRKDRTEKPLLLCENRIIWLAGYQIDNSMKITPATNMILKTELFLA